MDTTLHSKTNAQFWLAESNVYLQDNEELIARLSLYNNFLAILKLHRLQGVSHCQTFPLIQRLYPGATLSLNTAFI